MNQDPLGPCHHTHYDGGPHCVHTAYHQGSEDMLAKCITAVEALPPKYNESYLHDMQSVLAALRALQEKP